MPLFVKDFEISSEDSTDTVPTSIGCPLSFLSFISSIAASIFALFVL